MICCTVLLCYCIYKEGMSSACSQLLCECAAQGQPSALCADSCSGQAPVNKSTFFFSVWEEVRNEKFVGRDQYLVKLSLHLILSTGSLWRTEGTFCYSASWFPSTGANLPFYMIWHIPFALSSLLNSNTDKRISFQEQESECASAILISVQFRFPGTYTECVYQIRPH